MPHKGKKPAGGARGHGGKKPDGTSKPTDKKSSETAEKKHGATSTSASSGATAAASSSKVSTSQERTMKPTDTKPKATPKSEPAKSTQTTVPKSTTTTSSTVKPSTEKVPAKQDSKAVPQRKKSDTPVTSGAVGKAAVASVVAKSKPKDEVKEKKTVSVGQIAAAPATSDKDDAMDLLIDSLGGPDDVPESPKFTGPEIADTPATSEYVEELGKRDSTIPPEYRHLLDGKGDKPAPPAPKEAEKSLGDDDLVAAFSSDFVSSPKPPEEKKPKLEEKIEAKPAKPTSAVSSARAQPSDVTKSTTTTSSTVKPSTEKVPAKQDLKAVPEKKKSDTTATSGAISKAAAVPVVATSKPKDESGKDDALDLLIDTLGGPDDVPESPKFTGPEIVDTPATSEHVEELGKRDSTIPPEYRHLLDGKGDKPAPPSPAEKSLGDDDLVAAFSSDFVSSQAPPEEKKPKLEEKKDVKPTSSAPPAPVQSSDVALSEDALDDLLSTLEGPPTSEPDSPQFTGPEVTETITQSYVEELGKRDSTIPPAYRHLLDGKDHGKPVPPPAEQPPPMSDASLVDEFSKDFESCISPAANTTPSFQPKDAAQDKQARSDAVVPSSASSVQAATPPSVSMSALDELMGTLEGPEFSVPESPVYTGPEVTETATASYIEELGKRDSTIPPAYRHLLDGKADGKPVPQTPEEKPMTDSELLDAFDKEFTCPQPPVAQQTPPAKPKDALDIKKSESDIVVSSSAASSALQAAPAPSKAPAGKADPLDALAGTLGTREVDPKDKQPVKDKVKEKTGKENREKLGEDEETIPPDYRLKEVKDKDGKPLLPKPEEKQKAMTEDELLDALSEGFDTTHEPSQCAPLQSSAKPPGKPGSEEIVSCSKASAVQSSALKPSASIPDDALDLLSGSLGERQPDPDENKPIVDVVKEKAKEKHIDKLGDRDDTIPPEYRHLLDGKDQGKPAKPEAVKPKKSLDDAGAIDQLSSGFASCETSSSDKTQNSSKVEKTSSSTPVSKASGKVPESSKDKVEKVSIVQTPETSGKVSDSSKSTSQSTLEKPSAQKTSKS